MNELDLLDALGGIDESLLLRSECRPARLSPLRKVLIAAAAVMLLAMSALATPAVQKWVSGPTMTRVQIGRPYKTAEFVSFIEAFARVDLNLENPGPTPSTIEQLYVPLYFASDPRWTYYEDIRYPDTPQFTRFQGIWEKGEQRMIFCQQVINRATADHPAGYGQFAIDLGNNAAVEETTMTIGEQSYRVYLVHQSRVDAFTVFQAHIDVIWFDGAYAYQLIAEGMELEDIAEIIQTIGPVATEDYVRDARFDPIEVYYTLPSPYGQYGGASWQNYGYRTRQIWGTSEYGICLEQHRIQSAKSEVPGQTFWEMLEELRESIYFYKTDQVDVDGITVYIAHSAWDQRVLWQQDGYIFLLEFYAYRYQNNLKIADYVRSLTPVEELGKPPAE